jgi:hypothetical protein
MEVLFTTKTVSMAIVGTCIYISRIPKEIPLISWTDAMRWRLKAPLQ